MDLDVPEIDVIWANEPESHTPLGARGLGEIGITGIAAAIANALYNAAGKRIGDLLSNRRLCCRDEAWSEGNLMTFASA